MAKQKRPPIDPDRLREDIVFEEELLGHRLQFHTT